MRLETVGIAFLYAAAAGCGDSVGGDAAATDSTGSPTSDPTVSGTSTDGGGLSTAGSTDAVDSTTGPTSSGSESGTASSGSSGVSSSGSTSSGGAPIEGNLAFVTSQSFVPSDLGGLAGADAACAAAAANAGLPANTYLAWLSSSTVNADSAARIGNGARGWIRTDGRAFADQLSSLASATGSVWYPLRYDEFGNDLATTVVTATIWTGDVTGGTCADWTADDGSAVTRGTSSENGRFWTSGGVPSSACGVAGPLYCFGVDHSIPVAPARNTGRVAFLSASAFTPGGGLAAADAVCQSDADAAGLAGSFLALLATDVAAAADRFDLTGDGWVRLDGLWLFDDPAQLPAGEPLSGLMLEPDGLTYQAGAVGAWTGADTPADVSGGTSCNNWTSSDPADTAIWGSNTATDQRFFGNAGNLPCSFANFRVFCLQE